MEALKKKDITGIKQWQAEAYVSALLFCCLVHKEHPPFRLHLSKICVLYDIYGDIFDMDLVTELLYKVQNSKTPFQDFATNLRLLPKEIRDELYNDCSIIIAKKKVYPEIDPKQRIAFFAEKLRSDVDIYAAKITKILNEELK
jgi:hypothetical protein